jgi:hypothetical protein
VQVAVPTPSTRKISNFFPSKTPSHPVYKVGATMNHYPSGFNDLVFRRLFGSPENKDLLIDFLNAIFAHSGSPLIQDVDYLDPYQPSERLESKDSILIYW